MSYIKKRSGSAPFKKPRTVTQTKITGYAFQPKMVVPRGELKNIDNTLSTQIVAAQTTAVVNCINLIAQGTTQNERIGRRVTMKSLWVKWNFSLAPTTAGSSPIRIIVFYDKQTNAATPATTAFLENDVIDSFKNLSNERRFTTIMDELINPGIGTPGPGGCMGQRFIKMNHGIEYNTGPTAVVSAITTGALWLLCYQNGRLITANPTAVISTRVRFLDQ